MTVPQLKLTQVVIRGEGLPNDAATFDGVRYRRESGSLTAIYFGMNRPRWHSDVSYPPRNDDRMKITVTPALHSRLITVAFYGTDIDIIVEAAREAETAAGAVLALRPLLAYVQENFSTT